jgi:uncharacterized membrane protein
MGEEETAMESRAKLLGHPVHQILIPIPAGLFIVAAVLDIVGAFVETNWIATVTYWNIALGVVSALVAAVFGAIDWTKIPSGTRAKRVGTFHGVGNVIAVVLFGSAWLLRADSLAHAATPVAFTLEIVALLLLSVTAWLGGELVDRMGVGVDEGANVDAPSSLRVKHLPNAHSRTGV